MRKGLAKILTALTLAAVSVSGLYGRDTATGVMNPRFRSLQLTNADNFMGLPVIRLGTDDRLVVTFDELGDDLSYLQYRLIHCNADWQPSQLMETEYLDGFNIADVSDYAFSSNTYIHFVNYRIVIPGDGSGGLRPVKSGNYLLEVFDRNEPEVSLLQVRFSVSENIVKVYGEATGRTDRGLNTEWQQVNVGVGLDESGLRSPMTDVVLTVSQNGRPDATRMISHPSRLQGKALVYEHVPDLIFPAGNEYRRFETVRANSPGMGVDSTGFAGRNYHAWLWTDKPRAGRPYMFDRTQNGRYKVDEYSASDPDLGADYVTVHFELDHPEVMNADIYVDGDLANGRYTEANRMRYDHSRHVYTLEMPLKQGSYNYQYVSVPRGKKSGGDPSLVEGNHHETRNEYQVYVWLREPGSRADRLIGTAQMMTR